MDKGDYKSLNIKMEQKIPHNFIFGGMQKWPMIPPDQNLTMNFQWLLKPLSFMDIYYRYKQDIFLHFLHCWKSLTNKYLTTCNPCTKLMLISKFFIVHFNNAVCFHHKVEKHSDKKNKSMENESVCIFQIMFIFVLKNSEKTSKQNESVCIYQLDIKKEV